MNEELENVTDDNPIAPDEEVDLSSLLREGVAADDDDYTEDDEVDEAEEIDGTEGVEDVEDVVEEEVEETPEVNLLHPDEVNRIVQERLARDRKTQAVQQLEQITGMDMDAILEYVKNNQVQAKAEEYGIDEDEARRIIEQEQQLNELQMQMQQYQQQQEEIQKMTAYNEEKQQYLNNPLVKKYEHEIDAFAQNGMLIGFGPAMNYILGQKVLNGEILDEVRNATEQKTLANVNKRSKANPLRGSQGGQAVTETLTAQEKAIARALGVSPKDYAAQKARQHR